VVLALLRICWREGLLLLLPQLSLSTAPTRAGGWRAGAAAVRTRLAKAGYALPGPALAQRGLCSLARFCVLSSPQLRTVHAVCVPDEEPPLGEDGAKTCWVGRYVE
jgi:hypothetical protein